MDKGRKSVTITLTKWAKVGPERRRKTRPYSLFQSRSLQGPVPIFTGKTGNRRNDFAIRLTGSIGTAFPSSISGIPTNPKPKNQRASDE